MPSHSPTRADEVDQLMLNARLRDAIEPFLDDAIDLMDSQRMTTGTENEYLESMLAWEYAPVLPISRWFTPELDLPEPSVLDDQQIHEWLWKTIHRLDEQRIALAYTDHLSDRELYCILYRDILPAAEKKLERRAGYQYWFCLDEEDDPETWLRYYASEPQRQRWAGRTASCRPGGKTCLSRVRCRDHRRRPCDQPRFLCSLVWERR
jgi:hypothetical protein